MDVAKALEAFVYLDALPPAFDQSGSAALMVSRAMAAERGCGT
jgi:hypothetical protein